MRARCKRKEARVRGDADTGAELRLPPETPGAETHTPVFPKKGMVDTECSWAESSGGKDLCLTLDSRHCFTSR